MSNTPRYDRELVEFLEPPTSGRLVMLSDDPIFVRTLRTIVYKTLGLKEERLEIYQDTDQTLAAVGRLMTSKTPVLVLADRLLRGKPTLEFLRALRASYSAVKTLVMTQETTKDQISLLFEIGVDSVLTKPVSVDTLIEKMAGAIKPQGRISKMVNDARAMLAQGDTAGAMRIGKQIIEVKGSSAVASMLMGDAYMAEGKREDALREYQAAHDAARLFLDPIKKLADAHRGQDDEAYLRCLRKLDAISPLNPTRKSEIGKLYVRKNDAEQAERFFTAAFETAYEEAMGVVERLVADIAESVGEAAPALAEKYCVQLLEMKGDRLTPADMATFNRLGIALRRQGKWREAVENYKKALTVVPSDERVLYNMGLAYADGQMHRMAVGVFSQVLRVNPDFHKASAALATNMAGVYVQAKDYDMAKKLVSDALVKDPRHDPAIKLLAKVEAAEAAERGEG